MNPGGAEAKTKASILCVDDEPNVLEGLALTLGRRYQVETATSGAQALELLQRTPNKVVIVSDMRMPGMDGATFLARAREVLPDAVRILLTGQTDIESAISAVNNGQIFRFLTKPCAPPALLTAIAAAVEQNELITAQRVLLEQTLHGCIKALTDVLSIANPAAFGRATRIKQVVSELATQLNLRDRWQVEVGAMLSQLGHITLPNDTAEKVYFGQPLTSEEQHLVSKLPMLTEQLLGNIPRLEGVREILASYSKPPTALTQPLIPLQEDQIYTGAQLLRVAVDFDGLESHGSDAQLALNTMRARTQSYDPRILAALVASRGDDGPTQQIKELTIGELTTGMVLTDDVKMSNGILLAARGYEITARFLERVRSFPKSALKERVRVIIRVEPGVEGSWSRAAGLTKS